MNSKLIAELRKAAVYFPATKAKFIPLSEAEEILSRHEAEPRGDGLREVVKWFHKKFKRSINHQLMGEFIEALSYGSGNVIEWAERWDDFGYKLYDDVTDILSRPTPDKAVEPLAVLAERKGWPRIHISEFRGLWYFSFWEYMGTNPATREPISGPTYAAAEDKARQYLNGLEDKK